MCVCAKDVSVRGTTVASQSSKGTMKVLVSVVLVTVACVVGLTLVEADKICAVRKREVKSVAEEQNSTDDIEDAFNTNNYNQVE